MTAPCNPPCAPCGEGECWAEVGVIAPGVYTDLSNDAYHGETHYLSSSRLKALLPERYAKPLADSPAFAFGTLVHTLVLEPDQADAYVVLDAHAIAGDNPKTGKPYDAPQMTAKFKAARAEAEQSGRIVTTSEDWENAQRMRDAVMAHPVAAQLLAQDGARPEVSVFAHDDRGIGHKARFDLLAPVAVDLKTTVAKPGAESLARVVIDRGYDLSAAHYLEVAALAGIEVDAFALVFVGKTDPWPVTVAEMDDSLLARGRVLRAQAIERHTNPAAPRYEGADGFITLTAPRWAQIDEDLAS